MMPSRQSSHVVLFILAAFQLFLVSAASAQERMPSLNTVPLAEPPATNAWVPDRLAPNSFQNIGTFQGRANVLRIGLDGAQFNQYGWCASHGSPGTGSGEFPIRTNNNYNCALQGRIYANPAAGAWTLSADLWIENSWSNPANGLRRAELWGQARNSAGETSGFPSIGFTNEGNDGATGVGRFRWATGNWSETWYNVPAATAPVNYGAWNSFKIEFVPAPTNLFRYYVNGIKVAEFSSIIPNPNCCGSTGGESVGYNSVMLQTYNYTANNGVGYDVHWSNTPPPTPPGAPVIKTIVSGNNRLIATFDPPTDIGSSAITNYEYSVDGGANWITQDAFVSTNSTGFGTRALIINGLTNDTAYNVQLRAVNSTGPGAASTAVSGTPRKDLPLSWDASVDPTTLDSNGDGINDWVERNGGAFNGSLTGGIWTGGQNLDSRPRHTFESPFNVDLRWRAVTANVTNAFNAFYWVNIVPPNGGYAAVYFSLTTDATGNQTMTVRSKNGSTAEPPLATYSNLGTGFLQTSLAFDPANARVTVTINGTSYAPLSFFTNTAFNSDNFATIGGAAGKLELDYFGPCTAVTNLDTGISYCTIQSAIDAAQTLNGHTIEAVAGTYTENVTVNKAVTVRGPNHSIVYNGSRAAEAVIDGNVSITAAATFTGFEIYRPNLPTNQQLFSVTSGGTTVSNNVIRIGTVTSPTNQSWVLLNATSGTVNFSGNEIKSATPGQLVKDQAGNDLGNGVSGLRVEGAGTYTITGNRFAASGAGSPNAGDAVSIKGGTVDFNGNLINGDISGGITAFGGFGNVTIRNNTISGYWLRTVKQAGISVNSCCGFITATGFVTITNNIVNGGNVSGAKGIDIVGIPSTNILQLTNNDLSGNEKSIEFTGTGSLSATCNWYGQSSGPAAGQVVGSVNTYPFLDAGTNNSSTATGFTPGGSCIAPMYFGGSGRGDDTDATTLVGLDGTVYYQWMGGTSGTPTDWFTTSNWAPSQLPAPTDAVIIDAKTDQPRISGTSPGQDVTRTSRTLIGDNATLTLAAGPLLKLDPTSSTETSGTGRIILESGARYVNLSSSAPTLEVRRQLTAPRGWRMIASPVATSYADFLGELQTQGFPQANLPETNPGNPTTYTPNLMWWDESDAGTTLQGWRTFSGTTPLSNIPVPAGRGHFYFNFDGAGRDDGSGLAYTDNLPLTLAVTGTEPVLSTTPFTYSGLGYTERNPANQTGTWFIDRIEADRGWNLVGNPTASTLNWAASADWTRTNIGSTIYVWDPSAKDYLVSNGSGSPTLPNHRISPYQAFWVQATGASPVLSFTNAVKDTGAGTFIRKEASADSASVAALTIRLSAAEMRTQATVILTDHGRLGFDRYDAFRLQPKSDTWISAASSMDPGGPTLVINSLPKDLGANRVLPFYVGAAEEGQPFEGSFALDWELTGAWPDHLNAYLMDHERKEMTDMREMSVTEFRHRTEAQVMPDTLGTRAVRGKTADSTAAPTVVYGLPRIIAFGNADVRAKTADIMSQRTDSEALPRFTIVVGPERVDSYLPMVVEMSQNYPNPFNPSTSIRFALPEAANVRLEVYDVLGRQVATLASGLYEAGTHTMSWDAGRLSSGVYLYRLVTPNTTVVNKMTLIK